MQLTRVNGRPLPRVAAGVLAIATSSCMQGLAAQARQPPQERYGTHDWAAAEDRDETWVDCKSPGDGRTYVVGTAQVPEVIDGTEFSGQLLVPNPIGPTAAPANRTLGRAVVPCPGSVSARMGNGRRELMPRVD